jgi:hypothetical protein
LKLSATPAKSAPRPHLYQENGHHYISHHPNHKELWRQAAEESETEQDGEEDDNSGGDEKEEPGETEDQEIDEEPEQPKKDETDESELEPKLSQKVTKKPKVKSGGVSQVPSRQKAPPKKLHRLGQETPEDDQRGTHKPMKKASGGGESQLATRPKAPPKKFKPTAKDTD